MLIWFSVSWTAHPAPKGEKPRYLNDSTHSMGWSVSSTESAETYSICWCLDGPKRLIANVADGLEPIHFIWVSGSHTPLNFAIVYSFQIRISETNVVWNFQITRCADVMNARKKLSFILPSASRVGVVTTDGHGTVSAQQVNSGNLNGEGLSYSAWYVDHKRLRSQQKSLRQCE